MEFTISDEARMVEEQVVALIALTYLLQTRKANFV
tara:strand:+ start:1261 stop:1365 length:105 start_codon:yes stop_codon:yes gene_type:complete